jgi:hypothetical protein
MDCHHRTFLLFMFIMLFAAGYILVNQWPMKRKVYHNLHHTQNSRIAERLLPDLQRLDKFIDIQLSTLTDTPGQATDPVPTAGNVARYVSTMKETQKALTGLETTLRINYNKELKDSQIRALTMETQINNLFGDMNSTLLKELQKSYTRAHEINKRRIQTMKTIDDLPLKVMA